MKDINERIKDIENFYKMAYCVDGDVKMIINKKDFIIESIVELNDSKRGKFFIGKVIKGVSK